MRGGKISPSSTHTSGPHDAPKKITKRFAATSAIGPHGFGSDTSPPVLEAKLNASAITPSDIAMPTDPVSRIGRRPTLSTSRMATIVTTTLVTDVITVISRELLSVKPTAFQSVVE